jgi:single-stranded DNA-binding protein
LLIAVNNDGQNSSYIPAIAWGRNAHFAEKFDVGTSITLQGRFQSREYQKTMDDGVTENRIAYEVSVNKIEVCNDK